MVEIGSKARITKPPRKGGTVAANRQQTFIFEREKPSSFAPHRFSEGLDTTSSGPEVSRGRILAQLPSGSIDDDFGQRVRNFLSSSEFKLARDTQLKPLATTLIRQLLPLAPRHSSWIESNAMYSKSSATFPSFMRKADPERVFTRPRDAYDLLNCLRNKVAIALGVIQRSLIPNPVNIKQLTAYLIQAKNASQYLERYTIETKPADEVGGQDLVLFTLKP